MKFSEACAANAETKWLVDEFPDEVLDEFDKYFAGIGVDDFTGDYDIETVVFNTEKYSPKELLNGLLALGMGTSEEEIGNKWDLIVNSAADVMDAVVVEYHEEMFYVLCK